MKHFNTLNESRTANIQLRTKRWLYSLTLLFATMISGLSFGQVASYTFSQSSGTYTPITGGTLIKNTGTTSIDDDVYTNLDIGFTFNYNGTDYTKFSIASNGFIALGASVTSSTTPISGTSNNVISPLGDDLIGRQFVTASTTSGSPTVTVTAGSTAGMTVGDMLTGTGIATGATISSLTATSITMSANATSTGTSRNIRAINCGNIRYEVIGTAPNRTLVIQWNKYSRYITTAPSDFMNFQIRLNEGTNVINVVYDFPYVYSSTSITTDVGLRGASSADYNNRTSTTSWASTTAGASNTATITLTGAIYPASGQTFTWTPPVINTDLSIQSISGIPASGCPTASAPLSLVIKNNGLNTLDFSATNATFTLNITGASTQTLTATLNSGTLASGATQTVTLSPNAVFSAAGTHNLSATLTMTGDQVSSNNTATASKVIASVTTVSPPWTEGFATTTTPTGWNIGGFTIGANHGQTGNGVYKNMWSSATTGQFNTAAIGTLGSANYQLKFDYRVLNYNSTYPGTQVPPTGNWGNFKVQVSTDCGGTYTDLGTIDNTNHTVTDQSFTNKVYSLSAYNGQSVIVRILATWVAGDYFIDIDNFDISELSTDAMDWNNIQWLSDGTTGSNSSLSVPAGTTVTAYAQGYEAGVTDASSSAAGAGVQCWIGYSSTNSDPSGAGWTWTAASYNADSGSNDEFSVALPALAAGTYYTASRWTLNSGPYTYGGYNGPWNGTGNNNIELVVTPNPTQCAGITSPANATTGVVRGTVALTWTAPTSGPAPTGYKVYFGTTSGSLTLMTTTGASTFTYSASASAYNTTYYWKIVPTSTVGGDATGCTEWSFTTELSPFAPYCDVPNFSSAVEPITLVNFAGINNSTSATLNGTPSHENFISTSGSVTAGQSYDITLKGNTDGTYTDNFRVFIDWNQDGDFADAGETFTAGSIYNSTGSDAIQAVTSIAVPSNATAGTTRMRVKKLFGTTNIDNPCLSGGFGQVEEYSLVVTVPATTWASLQWPQSAEINFLGNADIFGQVFKSGVTEAAGQGSGIAAWVGISDANTNPNTWAESSWTSATYNTDSGNNDEYKLNVGYNAGAGTYILPGKYYYATRFQIDTDPYLYGGNKLISSPNEGGLWDGTTYKSGTLTVLTELVDVMCGATFTHQNNRLDAIPANGANMYKFKFVENGNTTEITKSTTGVVWNELGAAMKYNTPYQVSVAWSSDSGATWTNYGAACTVTLSLTTQMYRGCGTTYTNPNMRVEALPLSGATEYTFEFTNTSTSAVTEVVSTNPYTTFGAAAVPQGSYSVRIKVNLGSGYSPYGSACTVTYAIPLDTSKLLTTYCGTTMGHSNHRMDAEARTGATAWMFKFVEGSNTYEIPRTTNGITFATLGANLKYDTPYAISVKYQKDGVWSEYGPTCSVSVGQTTYVYVGCGSSYVEGNRIQALPILNATEYTFEFTNTSTNAVSEVTSANPYITFATTSLAAGTYSIRVKAMANGVYGAYGSACSITYAPALAKVSVYPNPFVNSFTVDIKDAQVVIYDQNGFVREEWKITNNSKPEMGTSLKNGLYFVHIKQQGAETKIVQVLKK